MKKNGGKFEGEEPKVIGHFQDEQEVADLIENAEGAEASDEEDNREEINVQVDEPEEVDSDDDDEEEKK